MNRREKNFQRLTGKRRSEMLLRVPTRQESFDQIHKQLKSNYPLRLIGHPNVYVTEEERSVNFHILGAPGEGKSRFIEYNIQKDIELENGLCLLDPSEGGDTVQHVLAYCEKIGFEKVILIDPLTTKMDKVPLLNPLNPKNRKGSVEGVMEALSILFSAKTTDTPRIRRNLQALLRVLTTAHLSLAETIYFADYWESKGYREDIFNRIKGNQRDVDTLRNVFRTEFNWQTYFSSTINRLDTFWEEPLSLMFGSQEGIDFQKAVSEGWVILVNLSPYRLNAEEARLLGIIVISQIVQAVNSLIHEGWKGVYYLYMDEAGRFATPQIEEVLTYKRKSGIRLILAHHGFEQFEDRKVMDSILNGARIKLMFDTPSHNDRLRMMKEMSYGGEIPPSLAAYANKNIPKQYAVIRKHKEDPLRIRTPDVPDLPKVSEAYLQKILSQPFYKSVQDIKDEINARITPKDSKSYRPRKTSHNKTARPPAVSKGTVQADVPKDGKKPSDPPPFKPIEI